MRGTPRARRAGNDAMRVLVAGEETAGRLAVIELRERRGSGSPRHIHTREDEVIYVLAGRVTFHLDGAAVDADAGDCVLLPQGGEHSYAVRSATARLLVVASPAGIEDYFRELGASEAPETAAGAVERLITAAARHGVRITGPTRQQQRAKARARPPPP